MSRPLLLDLFCCEGGAAVGYHRAGFVLFCIAVPVTAPSERWPRVG